MERGDLTQKDEREYSYREHRNMTIGDVAVRLGTILMWTVGLVIAMGQVTAAIENTVLHLAGEETLITFVLRWVESCDSPLTVSVSIMAGAGGVSMGLYQKRQRGKMVARLSRRIEKLEKKKDPNRTSSGLTREGQTNPDDR
ncbi:MAG: hypothetical protein A2516_10070 [Alphaproteobacteria bacterium RIFOXYD12_FULL_60_8]|nr:MAG: hypothetical protein A2516_10070 [Alphaproteobacteria bacterium RIFOXYD12_FULL_60_8]